MSLKDFEEVKRLDRKGLEDYYMCYLHHRHHRHNTALSCRRSTSSLSNASKDNSCPCTCEKEHFCTVQNASSSLIVGRNNEEDESFEDPSIHLCEHYK